MDKIGEGWEIHKNKLMISKKKRQRGQQDKYEYVHTLSGR